MRPRCSTESASPIAMALAGEGDLLIADEVRRTVRREQIVA
ncbi:hypothetical protein ACFV29_02275 [Streptomyces sp. NPDC059690]